MVMLDIVGLDVGFLAGLLGIIGASLAVCNCFQGMDLRSIVKVHLLMGLCAQVRMSLNMYSNVMIYFAGCSHFGLFDFRNIRTDRHSSAQCAE